MDLLEYSENIRSQNGEDGIIQEILNILSVSTPTILQNDMYFVEFGAWDGEFLSNTYNLMNNYNWGGLYIEANKTKYLDLEQKYKANKKITCINSFVQDGNGDDSLTNILKQAHAPKDFAILSIDIDGNDYQVWRDLQYFKPMLVIVEYNQTIPPHIEYIDEDGKSFMGSSCLSLSNLAKEKGYELICCTTTNCFFIQKDLFHLFNIINNSPMKLQAKNMLCFVGLNYAGEVVFSNKDFFYNKIKFIIYDRFKKIIKALLFRKRTFFFLGDRYE